MNSYFASCEQQDNPAWRGKPVGVCEHLGGIIIGASVEAKKWGISTGTPVWEAKKLYPKIVLTHAHPDRYRQLTREFIKVVSDYTDQVEVYSIDEVFADITASCNIKFPISNFQFSDRSQVPNSKRYQGRTYLWAKEVMPDADPWQEAVRVARETKKRIRAEVGDWLRCSVGLAENKLLAKIGSDMQKPDGLVMIIDKNDPSRLGSSQAEADIIDKNENQGYLRYIKDDLYQILKLTDVPGIGKRMEKRLNALGIKNLKDLRDYPQSKLVAAFGLPGYHLYNLGQLKGSAAPEVEEDDEIKSIGHMYTLPQEYRKQEYFVPVLYKLSEMVARRLRQQGLAGNVLHFYFCDRFERSFGKSRKLKYYLQEGQEIFLESMDILECAGGAELVPAGARLIGISVSGLADRINQLSLFGDVERQRRMVEALDKINGKYGDFTVCRAPVLRAGQVFRDSVGFGRIKELNKIEQK